MPSIVETPQSNLRFAVVRREITPPVGIYHRMWGAAAHDRATGVHRPLTATAMVFRPEIEDTAEVVLVALDLCLLWIHEMETLHRAVCRGAALDPTALIVTFSHTHAAGLMGYEREHLPGGELIRPYLDQVAESVAAAVEEARRGVRPVTVVYGYGRCDLAAHRDLWDEAAGAYVCGFDPATAADDTVLVARFMAGNETVATMVNYACHPTTLAWQNTRISPDYPGAMREVIEAATGAPCVFLQGAAGELGPREGFVGDVDVADRNGRKLGYAALATLESLPPPGTRYEYTGPVVSGATIGTWRHAPLDERSLSDNARWRLKRWTLELPHRAELPSPEATHEERATWQRRESEARDRDDHQAAADARAMVERLDRRLVRLAGLSGTSFAFPLTLLRAGGAFWLFVEGEPYSLLQREVRRRFPTTPIVVCELAGGSRTGYLPPRDLYGRGIYQESIAVLEPGCLEAIIEEVAANIENSLCAAQSEAPVQQGMGDNA